MSDGVLVYFGYPQAHEDDAEQAVRAALAVIEAVSRLPAREDLRVRLGIATGLAVVGDLIGEGAAQERGVVGETPNLAARLQALATPNTVVIAEATRRQIGQLFDLEDLGPQQLAGFPQLQRAWRVLGESGEVSRFEALRSGETPLVGCDEEIVTAATPGAGKKWRRTGGADFRRARHRQVATDGGTFRAHRKRAAHPAALFLLAAPPRQRALSLHRPARACRRVSRVAEETSDESHSSS
jgi:Adenylate and Guanylate cyclase catalytic domain